MYNLLTINQDIIEFPTDLIGTFNSQEKALEAAEQIFKKATKYGIDPDDEDIFENPWLIVAKVESNKIFKDNYYDKAQTVHFDINGHATLKD